MKQPRFYRRFDYDRVLLPNKYLSYLDDVKTIEEAKEKTGFSIGYPGWGLVYYTLISHLNPEEYNLIIETGTNQGCTTIMMAQALKDSNCRGKVYTVELDPGNYEIALNNFRKAGISDYIESINADSKKALKEIVNKHSLIRVAFLDASHLYEDVLEEFEIILPALGPQSIVIFDNTYLIAEGQEDQRVNGALKEILKRHGGNLINFEFVSWYTPGIAIWQKTPFNFCNAKRNSTSICTKQSKEKKEKINEKRVRHIQELTKDMDGRIVLEEAELLYFLASEGECKGEVVEIGSFQGYSTIWLASGSKDRNKGNIYSIDPQCTDLHGNNEAIFRSNIKKAGLDNYIVPIVKTSTEASKDWNRPIRLLFIDGAHDYENVKNDFLLWEKHLVSGGIVAFHDCYCIFWPDVGKVVNEYIFNSDNFSVIGCVNTIIYARKVEKLSPIEKSEKEELKKRLLWREKAVYNFQKIELMIKKGNYNEAESLLKSCENDINDLISPEYRLLNLSSIGACYKKIGKYTRAEEIFYEILAFENVPFLEKCSSLLNLGNIYRAQKNYREAVEKFKEALDIEGTTDEKKVELILEIGLCYSELGRNDEAVNEYEKALSFKNISNRSKLKLLLRVGNILVNSSKHEDAEQRFTEVLSMEDVQTNERFQALSGLGKCYFALKRYKNAVHKFTEALSVDKIQDRERFQVLLDLGRCHYALKMYHETEKNYQEALNIDEVNAKNRVTAVLELGRCYSDQGKYGEEEIEYLEALSFESVPNIFRYRLLNRLGSIYLKWGRHKDAESKFTAALSTEEIPEQDRYHALFGLGKCYYSLGRYGETENLYKTAFSFKDISDESRFTLANGLIDCYLSQGKFHDLEETCEKVLSLSGITEQQKLGTIKRVKERIGILLKQQGGINA